VFGWERFTGLEGRVVGMKSFGVSAPGEAAYAHFGITVEKVVAAAKENLS
jgi:transketolase